MFLLLLVLSLKTILRNEEWKNTGTLAVSGLRTNPMNPKIYVTMANTLVEKVTTYMYMYILMTLLVIYMY